MSQDETNTDTQAPRVSDVDTIALSFVVSVGIVYTAHYWDLHGDVVERAMVWGWAGWWACTIALWSYRTGGWKAVAQSALKPWVWLPLFFGWLFSKNGLTFIAAMAALIACVAALGWIWSGPIAYLEPYLGPAPDFSSWQAIRQESPRQLAVWGMLDAVLFIVVIVTFGLLAEGTVAAGQHVLRQRTFYVLTLLALLSWGVIGIGGLLFFIALLLIYLITQQPRAKPEGLRGLLDPGDNAE